MCPPSSGSSGSMLKRNRERLKPASRKSIIATLLLRRDVEGEDLAADPGRADHAHRGVRLALAAAEGRVPQVGDLGRAGRRGTRRRRSIMSPIRSTDCAEGLLDDAGGRGEAEEAGGDVLALDVARRRPSFLATWFVRSGRRAGSCCCAVALDGDGGGLPVVSRMSVWRVAQSSTRSPLKATILSPGLQARPPWPGRPGRAFGHVVAVLALRR